MLNFLNNKAAELKQGGIRDFFDRAKYISNPINMCIGEPDQNTPDEIIEAAHQVMLAGKTHYTANAGDLAVRESIADYLNSYNAAYNADKEIIITCGGMGAVSMCFFCTIEPGDEVIVQDPQWLNYQAQICFAGGVPVKVPVWEEDEFSLCAENVERYITEKTKIIIINSPNNPTGAVLDEQALRAIADLAVRHNLLVISDEVYSELIYDGKKHVTIAAIPGMAERTVIINSLSKTFSMTGWRIGYAAGPSEIISKMTILQENLVSCAPVVSQFAAKYALETMCDVSEVRRLYQNRRDLIVKELNAIDGIHCLNPRGSFYVFPCIKSLGKSSMEFANGLLEATGVIVTPGNAFGPHGEGYVRISFANSESNIVEALNRIDNYAKSLLNLKE